MDIVEFEGLQLLELTDERMDKSWEYLEQHARNEQRFIVLHDSCEKLAAKLGGAFTMYVALRFRVNRDATTDYARLGMYYQLGHLPAARSQENLAEAMNASQPTIARWFGLLEEIGAIEKLGRERTRPGRATTMNVYTLGNWRHTNSKDRLELFFFDALAGRYVEGQQRKLGES